MFVDIIHSVWQVFARLKELEAAVKVLAIQD